MKIRPLIFHDSEKILRLLRQRSVFNEKEIQAASEVIDDTLCQHERKDYQAFCALDDNGRLTGYICFGLIPMTDGCYELYWVVADEKFSRNGVGGKLLGFMEEFVTREEVRRIYVETSSTPPYEPARSFYEKRGYKKACILMDFYREGDHKVIYMKEVEAFLSPS